MFAARKRKIAAIPSAERPLALSAVLAVLLLALPAAAPAVELEVDLGEMADKVDFRYRWAETGELPAGYILLGDPEGAVFLHRGFLPFTRDYRISTIEYDPASGSVFSFTVPGHVVFVRREERDGIYYRSTTREVASTDVDVAIVPYDIRARDVWREKSREVWIEDVKYGLTTAGAEGAGRGGLIDINIPLKLPSQLEAIFGRGEETRLTVSGREKITIGGTSRWCANCPRTEGMPQQQKFPDLDMEQQLSVNLHGNIGEKINVAIDHSSMGGGVSSTNRVRLNYTGFDDEIIKLIEMGDTDLTLSGAQLISYSGAAKGLFGVKGVAQVGPLDLTVIASKEEGESSSGSFTSSGGQATETAISDYNYIRRQFFYFETPGDGFDSPQTGFLQFFPVVGGAESDSIEVLVSLRPDTEWRSNTRPKYYVHAYADDQNDGLADEIAGGAEYYDQWFYPLYEGVDYDLIQDYSSNEVRYIGIRLRQRLGADKALAIRYRMSRFGNVVTVGDYGNFPVTPIDPPPNPDEFIQAELICPPEDELNPPSVEGDPYSSTWHMMMRNVYSIGTSGLEDANLEVKIREVGTIKGTAEIQSETGERYLQIFGLDRYDNTGDWGDDGLVDVIQGVVNFRWGYMMFPWFEPFKVPQEEIAYYFGEQEGVPDFEKAAAIDAALERNSVIYDTLYNVNNPPNYYEIVISASSGSRVFNLPAFDILEGTEVVSVDGVRLSRGVDYDIDYLSGTVTLKGEVLTSMTPDSRVNIDYQHKPLVGGGKSSLLGVGANLNLSENTRMNATFLYNSVGSPRYTPRLGEEPTRTMAADVNGSFQFQPSWMTSMANLLPRVDTDSKSNLNLTGEVAVSFPNPNTKGEAFVDDMEGIEDSDQLQLVRRTWYEASPPLDPENPGIYLPAWSEDFEFYWYNPANTEQQKHLTTSKKDLNPLLNDRENIRQTSLFLKSYNAGPGSWGGVMTGFPGGLDLTTAQYLEVWVNDYGTEPEPGEIVLHIDFGRIDEDFHLPGADEFNDENQTTWTNEDDIGFPGDDPDKAFNAEFNESTWDRNRKIYRWINSRIGNSYHDSEDTNRNGRLDQNDEYYSLTLDLADSAIIDVWRDFPEASGYWNDAEDGAINIRKRWRMYRLDLARAELPAGVAPRIDKIQHMRIWVENIDRLQASNFPAEPSFTEQSIEITGMKFVGSRWEFNHIREIDEAAGTEEAVPAPPGMRVKVGTINNKDNPSIYRPPYDVLEEEGLQNREQSLLLDLENFETGHSFRVMKRFFGQGEDFQQYRELKFFVLANNNLSSSVEEGLDFYLQIAYDSLNYYELEVPLTARFAGKWQYINVTMADLTNLKIGAAPGEVVESVITDSVDPSRKYAARVVGDPTLFKVRYLFAGARNTTGIRLPNGQIWFNDIGLGEVRRDIDHAERLSASASFANILSINASYQRTGPEFRSLKQKTGSGTDNSSIAFQGKSEVNHFVPTGGFQLPVSLRYSSSTLKPKYLTQSDVEIIDQSIREDLRTERNNYTYSVSLSRRGSSNFLMKHLFDNLKAGYSYSKNRMFSPTALDTSWSQSWNTNYQVQFGRDRTFKLPGGLEMRYWLTNLTINASGSKSVRTSYSLNNERFIMSPIAVSHGWDNEISTSYDPFESMKFNYRRSENRNMRIYREAWGIPVGRLNSYQQSLEMQYQPRGDVFFISQFSPRFEYTARYDENLDPSIRQQDDPRDTRNVSNSRNINIVFDVDVGGYAIDFGRITGLLGEGETAQNAPSSARAASARRKADFEKLMQDRLKKGAQEDRQEGAQQLPGVDEQAQQQPPPAPQEGQEEQEEKGGYSDLLVKRPRRPIDASAAAADTAAADTAEVDTTGGGGPDPWLAFRQALRFIGKIQPIKSSVRIDDSSNYQRLHERADWRYIYGLTKKSGVIGSSCDSTSCEPENSPLRGAHRISLDFRSGISLTSNLSADVRLNYSMREDEADNRLSESTDITWPDVSINWKGLERWGPLESFVKHSDLTVSYIRKTSESIGSDRDDMVISPNWSMSWKNSLSTNFQFSYSKQTRIEKKQEMWDKTWSANLELRYEVKGSQGIGIPLPFMSGRKIKFESTLNTVLNIGYSSTESHNIPPSNVLTVSPRFTYTFSRNVNGGLTASYKRSSGGIYGYINHEVGLHANAEFKF